MSKRGDRELLSDMLESIRRVEMYINQGDYQDFINDLKTQDAVIRALEILGEASKGISPKVKEQLIVCLMCFYRLSIFWIVRLGYE